MHQHIARACRPGGRQVRRRRVDPAQHLPAGTEHVLRAPGVDEFLAVHPGDEAERQGAFAGPEQWGHGHLPATPQPPQQGPLARESVGGVGTVVRLCRKRGRDPVRHAREDGTPHKVPPSLREPELPPRS
ncbi:hypothetical protein [Streptomyces dysideae]|uniref:hypothetical protein n=1 Tax=Streptomyces dysideae TaxID=909626 RepID=UPI000AABAA92|nr:hypothetical protein [Streptomyces dysideae]